MLGLPRMAAVMRVRPLGWSKKMNSSTGPGSSSDIHRASYPRSLRHPAAGPEGRLSLRNQLAPHRHVARKPAVKRAKAWLRQLTSTSGLLCAAEVHV